MPRARNIKPAIFDNEFLGELPSDIMLLFIGLWTQADREGVIEYRVAKLRKALFGFRTDVQNETFNGYITVLTQLDNSSMLRKVVFDEKEYLIIMNFMEHQHPHHTEKKGRLPSREALLSRGSENLTVRQPLSNGYNPSDSGFLIPDSSIKKNKTNVLSKKGKGTRFSSDAILVDEWVEWTQQRLGWSVDDIQDEFETFQNYWVAKAGQDGVKLDWYRTWQNWCKNSKRRVGGSNGQGVSKSRTAHESFREGAYMFATE